MPMILDRAAIVYAMPERRPLHEDVFAHAWERAKSDAAASFGMSMSEQAMKDLYAATRVEAEKTHRKLSEAYDCRMIEVDKYAAQADRADMGWKVEHWKSLAPVRGAHLYCGNPDCPAHRFWAVSTPGRYITLPQDVTIDPPTRCPFTRMVPSTLGESEWSCGRPWWSVEIWRAYLACLRLTGNRMLAEKLLEEAILAEGAAL